MRVLFVNDYALPLGGAEIMTFDLSNQLRSMGHEVRIFASRSGTRNEVSAIDYSCFGLTNSFRTALQTANLDAAIQLRKSIADFHPDVVHVKMFLTQLSPFILPQLCDVPALYHAVWYRAVCPLGTKLLPSGEKCAQPAGLPCLTNACIPKHDWGLHMAQRAMLMRWRAHFDKVVANSETTRCKLAEGGFASYDAIDIVWNGVPYSERACVWSESPSIVFTGRLVREKGVHVLLRAFAQVHRKIPNAKLTVCGDGGEKPKLQRLARGLGIEKSVIFTGHLSRAESEILCEQAWVQAVPSLWDEPFGNVVAEAMMRGTAVLASDAGGPREVIQSGCTGILVPAGDVDAWTAALESLLRERTQCQKLAGNGRDFARQHLTIENCAQRFDSIYRTMTKQSSEIKKA